MTASITAVRSDLEFTSPGNRQADAENQREAWLRQMELSQMSLLQMAGQQNGGPSGTASAKSQDEQQSEHNPSATGQTIGASPDSATAFATATLLPVHPILAQFAAQAGAGNDGRASPFAPDTVAANNLTQSNPAASASAQTKTAAASTEPSLKFAALQQKESALLKSAQDDLAASSPLPAALSAALAPGQPNSAAAQQISVSGPANANLPANIGLRMGADLAPQAKEEAGETSEPPKANSDVAPDATNDVWQKRLMHVAQNGQDLSVSIRDNALDLHQSTQIVYRLAGDAAQSGLRLRNATVNGKTLLRLPRGNSSPSLPATRIDSGSPSEATTPSLETQEQ